MKVLTSVTLHTTSEGQRVSYTYSEIDDETGVVKADNIRESRVVMPIAANSDVLTAIEAVKSYVNDILQ